MNIIILLIIIFYFIQVVIPSSLIFFLLKYFAQFIFKSLHKVLPAYYYNNFFTNHKSLAILYGSICIDLIALWHH